MRGSEFHERPAKGAGPSSRSPSPHLPFPHSIGNKRLISGVTLHTGINAEVRAASVPASDQVGVRGAAATWQNVETGKGHADSKGFRHTVIGDHGRAVVPPSPGVFQAGRRPGDVRRGWIARRRLQRHILRGRAWRRWPDAAPERQAESGQHRRAPEQVRGHHQLQQFLRVRHRRRTIPSATPDR